LNVRRLAVLASIVAFAAVWAEASAAVTAVPQTQDVAALLKAHVAYSGPSGDATRLELVPAKRPLTWERTVLPVLGESPGADGLGWLRVSLPGRPNGHSGWIRQRSTKLMARSWHIVVNTSRRTVTAYKSGRPVRTVKAVVGKSSTPTPHGVFFVEEAIQLRPSDVGGPFALALSARSNVLQEFDGGPGQIGVHGLRNVGGVLGTAVSHGCVRLDNATMRWLVLRIAPGTPITITG
jgi:lipoprotein-anchoring transpeptidase ErfK/SrfK